MAPYFCSLYFLECHVVYLFIIFFPHKKTQGHLVSALISFKTSLEIIGTAKHQCHVTLWLAHKQHALMWTTLLSWRYVCLSSIKNTNFERSECIWNLKLWVAWAHSFVDILSAHGKLNTILKRIEFINSVVEVTVLRSVNIFCRLWKQRRFLVLCWQEKRSTA